MCCDRKTSTISLVPQFPTRSQINFDGEPKRHAPLIEISIFGYNRKSVTVRTVSDSNVVGSHELNALHVCAIGEQIANASDNLIREIFVA